MNREQAEKLLAALIFDDLDEASKAELQAYLKTDDELRERLADLRMAAKLTNDAVKDGPDPVLSEERLENLRRLAGLKVVKLHRSPLRWLTAVAAVLVFGLITAVAVLSPMSRRMTAGHALGSSEVARIEDASDYEDESHDSTGRPTPRVASGPVSGPAVAKDDLYVADAGTSHKGDAGTGGMVARDGIWGDSSAAGWRKSGSLSDGSLDDAIARGIRRQTPTISNDATATPPASPPLPVLSGPQVATATRSFADRVGVGERAEIKGVNGVQPPGGSPVARGLEMRLGWPGSVDSGKFGESLLDHQKLEGLDQLASGRVSYDKVATHDILGTTLRLSPPTAAEPETRLGGLSGLAGGDGTAGGEAKKPADELSLTTITNVKNKQNAGSVAAASPPPDQKPDKYADVKSLLGTQAAPTEAGQMQAKARAQAQTDGDNRRERNAPDSVKQQNALEGASDLQIIGEPTASYSGEVTYPKDWRELSARSTRQPEGKLDKDADVKLSLNFQDAPVDGVLKYLSEKAGLTVVAPGVPLDSRVTVNTSQPVTVDEAVSLLNSLLTEKDVAAVRAGDTLHVTTVARARQKNLPIVHVTKPSDVEDKDEIATFVIPVRYVDAQTLAQNLVSMLPEYATLEADRDSNVLIVTDAGSNVRRMMKIVEAMDTHTPTGEDIRVWRISNAKASTTSQLINNIFQQEAQAARSGGGMGGMVDSALGGNQAAVAAADDRTNSLVVKGTPAALDIINEMIQELDKRSSEITDVQARQPGYAGAGNVGQGIATSARPATQQTARATEEDADTLPAESRFKVVAVNPWVMTERDALSTFALNVDTASYALCRRYIRKGYLPPIGAVRMEEFINAFDYAYPQRDDATFAVYADGAPSPLAQAGQDVTLLKIAVKARTVGRDQRRPAHLVFVVDASASMGQPDRLPAVQSALDLLVAKLSDGDRVSLVTCAKDASLHLEAVSAKQKDAIRQKIDAIQPSGPTNLLAGLRLGYATARKAFVAGQINQVVLCSDGVANIGQTDANDVLREVAADRKQGITITCVGVGYGAYNDAFLEGLSDRGDGRYVFLDPSPEAQSALVTQLASTLQVVAKDARIQVQFNPSRVRRYRLIGYENRDIEDKRFRDDTIDAGAVGSGQCSTALYEVELTGNSPQDKAADIGTVFVRYRNTDTSQMEEISRPLAGSIVRQRSLQEDPRFFLAVGAARFAEWLRQSEHVRNTSLGDVQRVLDQVSAALPLDRDIQDLAALAHQAENLPRAP